MSPGGMEDLDNLTNAGCSLFDLNWESLNKTNWSETPLGPRDHWSSCLLSFVNIIATLPHASAVFWQPKDSDDFTVIYNLKFGKAACISNWQGKSAGKCLSEDGLKSLHNCLRGRTVQVESASFLSDAPKKAANCPTLLSSLLNDDGKRCGVFAQFLPQDKGNSPTSGEADDVDDDEDDDDLGQLDKGEDKESSIDLKSNKLFQKFAQMLPTGLAILNSDAEALFVNREFYTLTSDKNQDLDNFRCWPESIHEDDFDRVMDAYRKAFTSTDPLRVEFRCAEKDDRAWRLFMMRSLAEQPDKGGFICAVVDVSEIKAAELSQRKAAAEAKERKEQQERFIDMISHEIRNPLSAVLHSAEEIKDIVARSKKDGLGDDESAEIIDSIDTILLCVAHQSTLVDDILSFSKLDAMMLSLNPKKTQPKISFAEALKLFQPELRAKKIEFEYVLDVSFTDNKLDWVLADMKRIKQILVNLLTNAIKFTARAKGEKKIVVALGVARERPTSYPPNVVFFASDESYRMDSTLTSGWGEEEALYLMVAIKDTGIGISATDQKKLFERFRQATPKTQEKYGGSGLGLFISRKLCQLHGGDIGVSSKEGSGSTFGFFFKVRRSKSPSEQENEEVVEECSSLSVQASELLSNSKTGESSIVDADGAVKEGISPVLDEMATQLRMRNLVDTVVVDKDDDMECLKNPDVRLVAEAHPAATDGDDRYDITNEIASDIESEAKENRTNEDAASARIDDGKKTKERPEVTNDNETQKSKDNKSQKSKDEKSRKLKDDESKRQRDDESKTQRDDESKRSKDNKSEAPNDDESKTVLKDDESKAPKNDNLKAPKDEESKTLSRKSSASKTDHETHDSCSVLLVEDNQINQKVLTRQLRSRGFRVTPANHGLEAVEIVKSGTEICAVLMDQEMPVMDGNTATKAIREYEKKEGSERVTILGVSANVRGEQKDAMISSGMDETISKPFKVDDLVKRIKHLLSVD